MIQYQGNETRNPPLTSMRKTILILLLAASFVAADPKKKSQDLPPATASGTVEVIIQFHNKKDLDKTKHKSAKKKLDLDLIDSSTYELSPADVDLLSDDPDVKYISPNRGVRPLLDLAAPAVGADLAQKAGWDGDGVGIAIKVAIFGEQ